MGSDRPRPHQYRDGGDCRTPCGSDPWVGNPVCGQRRHVESPGKNSRRSAAGAPCSSGGALIVGNLVRLRDLGTTYGGLSGKTKEHFGHGTARFVTFTGVMAAARLRGPYGLASVDVHPRESQNQVRRGDLLFNGTSETPEDV